MTSAQHRTRHITTARRIVVKIGTNVIGGVNDTLDEERLHALSGQIAHLLGDGRRVAVVSSGAIGAGMKQLGLLARPRALPTLQAAASVGQAKLVSLYDKSLMAHGFHAGQILLTRDDFDQRQRYLNAANTIHALFDNKCVPVINENDTISTEEIRFGDNDLLAAFVTHLIRADLLVLLTSAPGLCARPPFPDNLIMASGEEPDTRFGRRVDVVRGIDEHVAALAFSETSPGGTGGMQSKIASAKMAVEAGEAAVIADGQADDVLVDLLNGDNIGTLFLPVSEKLGSRKRWIRFSRRSRGTIKIDTGAARALREKGKSLLPSGIVGVDGDFACGDTVTVRLDDGSEVARGLTNYSAADILRVKGRRTDELADILGEDYFDEVIHRDNMAVL